MLISNRSLTALLGSLSVAGSVYAAEMESTTRAPVQNIFPNAYSETEVAHFLKRNPAKPDQAARVDAVYKLGSTFFNGVIDSKFVLGLKKYSESSQFHSKAVDWETFITAYQNDYVQVQPYVLASFSHTDREGVKQPAKGRVGLVVPASYEVSTPVGALAFGGYYDVGARVNNSYKVKVTEDGKIVSKEQVDEDQLALTGEKFGLSANDKGEYEVQPQTLGVRQEAAVTLGFKLAAVNGLGFEWRTRHVIDSDPVMEYDRATNTIAPRRGGALNQAYLHTGRTEHRIRAKYDLNETFYVQNDFNLANKPVDEKLNYVNVFAVGAYLL